MGDLTTVASCSAALQLGQISAVELTQEYLRSIAVHNPTLNAFITTAEQRALEQARQADLRRAAGTQSPPHRCANSTQRFILHSGLGNDLWL